MVTLKEIARHRETLLNGHGSAPPATTAKAQDRNFDETLIGLLSRRLRRPEEHPFTPEFACAILDARLLAALNKLDLAEWAMRRLIQSADASMRVDTAEATDVCDELAVVVADLREMKERMANAEAKVKADWP